MSRDTEVRRRLLLAAGLAVGMVALVIPWTLVLAAAMFAWLSGG